MMLKLNAIKGKGKYLSPRGRIALNGQFYNVTVASDIGYDEHEIPFAVLFRPGDSVFDYYKTATHLAPYYERLATLDVTRSKADEMAYLLGRYLIYQWCIREPHGNLDQSFTVETLLLGAGIEKESNATKYDRFVGYFDRAFEILGEIGFLPKDENGIYFEYLKDKKTGAMPPNIECYGGENGKKRKPHGWFETWLAWRIHIEPPPESRERSARRVEAKARRIALEMQKPRRRKSTE
jgi:hypothetical protein